MEGHGWSGWKHRVILFPVMHVCPAIELMALAIAIAIRGEGCT
jgi:membrane-associated PAP2 superfamily phosphatase